jgi:hypothetical protein
MQDESSHGSHGWRRSRGGIRSLRRASKTTFTAEGAEGCRGIRRRSFPLHALGVSCCEDDHFQSNEIRFHAEVGRGTQCSQRKVGLPEFPLRPLAISAVNDFCLPFLALDRCPAMEDPRSKSRTPTKSLLFVGADVAEMDVCQSPAYGVQGPVSGVKDRKWWTECRKMLRIRGQGRAPRRPRREPGCGARRFIRRNAFSGLRQYRGHAARGPRPSGRSRRGR